MSGYTVLDLETTGLFPQQHDRVVEIGVVFVSDGGEIEGTWSSLVNPQRDVGPTHIHGVSARDVLDAPTFSDLAPAVMQTLQGRRVVAHNLRFELRFLEYEFLRAGMRLEPGDVSGICTMEWAPRYVRAASRKLVDCCDAAGVSLTNPHDAGCDARATAELLIHLMGAAGNPPPWASSHRRPDGYEWGDPVEAMLDVESVARTTSAPSRPDAWLDRIVAGMPRWDDIRVESYLEVLESALLDRYLSAHEEQALVETAVGLGIERSRLEEIHRQYLVSMAAVALADDIVTADERRDLDTVAGLLGLGPTEVDSALKSADPRPASQEFALLHGDWICLTGTMERPRSEWEDIAATRGVQVGGLTKRTKLLVAADPDSQSGKAGKARGYGIPIVNEEALGRLLGL